MKKKYRTRAPKDREEKVNPKEGPGVGKRTPGRRPKAGINTMME